PLLKPDGCLAERQGKRGLAPAIGEFNAVFDLKLSHYASAEAQAAALSDGIAYNAHDLDDGLRAGLIDLEQTGEVDLLRAMAREISALYPRIEPFRAIHELVRRTITFFIEDALTESRRRIAASDVASAEDVRALGEPLIGFSQAALDADASLRTFLCE